MKYVQVCKALYDYDARTEDELSIKQDDVLYVIEKEDDDWWRTELKQSTGEEQGPVGLVPADYLEEVTPIGRVRAEYDYVAQQEEELSFEEGVEMDLLEQDDPDWYLVKLGNGEIGLAPSNYVQAIDGADSTTYHHEEQPIEQAQEEEEEQYHQQQAPIPTPPPIITQASIPPPPLQPVLSQPTGGSPREPTVDDAQSWNVHEYDAAKKKKKKGKGNLFIGNGMICYGSETDKSLPVQQYPILDVTKYLFDGKNLHIEIEGNKQAVLDLQASSKSEAKAILVKISDSARAAQQSNTHLNLQQQRQMAAPATPIAINPNPSLPALNPRPPVQAEEEPAEEESNCVPKWGISIYSFQAEGGDELSVEENEQIYVLDYERTDGWWRVQKVDGDTGLVPSSYVQFDDDDDDTPVGAAGAAGLAAGAAAAAAAAAGSAHSRADNVEEIRRKREEEERVLQQKRIAEEEAREQQRRREQEDRRGREEEENRRREEDRHREEEERDRRRQVQEAAKRAEAARQKQIEEDYKRKEAERRTTLARSATTGSSKSSSSSRHQDLPKPDFSKIRTWTDRSGSFRVEAQFIDYHNGKLRLHKLNGVKIDVPVEKMCAEDVRWVEDNTRSPQTQEEITPSMPSRPPQQPPQPVQQQAQQPAKPPQKKYNERWDWFDWFMVIGIPMQASLQYASAFKADKLDDSDIHSLTHKQMKTLGIKEEHVQRIERYIETGQPEDISEDGPSNKQKDQSQVEKDEELARKLQREWEVDNSKGKASGRPRPTVSAPKDVHPDLLDFIGTQFNSGKGNETEKPKGDLVGFNDDAWTPRSESSPVVTMSPMKVTPAAPAPPAGPTPEQIKAAEAERKRLAEEEQIQKIQLMSLQRQAQEQQKQLEELQKLTKQQLELQKQIAMQTGNQQQQAQQQLQMQQVQAQQQQLQQQLAQQPPQLQPSLTLQPQQTAANLGMQPTGMQQQQQISAAAASRQRPIPNNRLTSDLSLGQWQPGQQQQQQQQPFQTGFQQQQQLQQPLQTGFQQQAMQTGFQPQQQQQQQQPTWQGQQLQPQMTGFPASSQPVGGAYGQQQQQNYQQPMATATVPLSSVLPQPLLPSATGQQQGGLQRAQTIGVQSTGRHWGSSTPANPFGSPTLSPLQAQMTGVQFSTPSPQAFHQSPLQSQQPTGYMQPQMTGFQQQPQLQQPQPTGNNIFTPQGSMQYGQTAFPNNQRPW